VRQYVTAAALACLLAAGGCSAKHPADTGTAASAVAVSAAIPATAAEPAISVLPELPPPKSKKPVAVHKRGSATAHRAPPLEDPRRIPQGISYDEMVRRFGPPSIAVTDGPGRSSLSYTARSSRVQVELQDGHVISVASSSTGH
jgi:hypothetical protein